MKKLINFLETRFIPVAGKIGSQRHLIAIREGFIVIMPLIIAGSMAVLLNNLGIPAYQNMMDSIFGDNWRGFGSIIYSASFSIISVLITFSVSYNLAKSYDIDPLAASLLSVANFFIFVPQNFNVALKEMVGEITIPAELVGKEILVGGISRGYTGAIGLFAALLIAILTTELFVKLTKSSKLEIKMPENVPPGVVRSFAVLIPVMIVVAVSGLLSFFIASTGNNIFDFIINLIQKPLMSIGGSLIGAILLPFLNSFLWFFGLHGGAILDPVKQLLNTPVIEANLAAITAGQPAPYIFSAPFESAFVVMGGSGTTLSLIIAIFISSKRKHYRSLAKLGAGPGIFNINETMIFGMPIVLNPIFFIPFLLSPVVLSLVAYTATALGLVPPVAYAIPWTTPPIIGGFLATGGSIAGGILSVVNLAIACLIYMPFIAIAEKIEATKIEATE